MAHHDTGLLMTLALAFAAAFVGGAIASRLRLPPVVGYLVAGVAVGPYTPGPVADARIAAELAEVGVILLMFGVGLHFSFRDLWAVRAIAVPGAISQIAVTTALGVGLTSLWGWSLANGLVFGLALSVASTVVLLRALGDAHLLETDEGRIAVGWLIVEDLAMVLTLVLLPAIAGALGTLPADAAGLPPTGGSLLLTLGLTLAKVALFATAMLVVGTRLFPWILARVVRTGSRELFTVSILATSVGVAYFAAGLFDVSFALGAFFAGVVVGGSHLDREVAEDSRALQDAFAVLFFVSVGMIVDPRVLLEAPLGVLGTLAVILACKSLAAFGIVWLFKFPLQSALIVAVSLAQIGEFSFILAAVGVQLGMLTTAGQHLILAGAIVSIALNPFLFGLATRLAAWLAERPRFSQRFQRHTGPVVLAWADHAGAPRDHVVVAGHGRVGSWIVDALGALGTPVLVIERHRPEAEELYVCGVPVVFGDATKAAVLELAGLAHARLLVVTVPGANDVRAVVAGARAINPGLPVIARTHSALEYGHLERHGVDAVVYAEQAVAQEMLSQVIALMSPQLAGPSEGPRG